MKKLVLTLLLVPATALGGELIDLGGVAEFVADIGKQAKGATLVNADYQVSGGLYVPVWTFHSNAIGAENVDYVELGAGAQLEDKKGKPLLAVAFNLPALSAKIWSSQWAREHVKRLALPPVWFGPYVKVPLPRTTWLLKKEVGVMISIALGGK